MPTVRALLCLAAALTIAAPPVAADDIVANAQFASGGYTYADHWRPLPSNVRMLRRARTDGGHNLYLQLRDEGDGGVMQIVELPPERTLSLRMLATCWADGNACVVAGLTRVDDGVVLAEIRVDGIERGELSANFDTGAGGQAELMVRLVGNRGARALVEHVTIGPPIDVTAAERPVFHSGDDLVLASGDGLRVDAGFTPRLLPAAAEMLQKAIEDVTGRPTERVASTVTVSVTQPEATDWPARESYHLNVSPRGVTIEAPAEQGAFWAMMTLIDLIRPEPDGGARILAVDVQDAPALPWRIGVDPSLMVGKDVINGARRLARLKLNMGLVASRPDLASEVAETMRAHGVEPVLDIPWSDVRVTAVLDDAVTRLGARYVVVSVAAEPEGAGEEPQPLDWANPPLSEAVEFARTHPDVAVIVPAARSRVQEVLPPMRFGPGTVLPATLEGWPPEIIALLPPHGPERLAQVQAELQARDIRYITTSPVGDPCEVEAALAARRGTDLCLGSVVEEKDEDAANLAWRGLPEEMR